MSVGSSSSSRLTPRQLEAEHLQPGLLPARQRLERRGRRRPRGRSGPARPWRPGGRRSSSARLSSGVRPVSHSTSSVWWNRPTCTRAPSRQVPGGARPCRRRRAAGGSATCRCRSGPSTATRSPAKTSRSNGSVRPTSSSASTCSTRWPDPAPTSFMCTLAVGRRRRRRTDRDEALPARLGRVGPRRVAVVDRRPLLHDLVVLEEASLLVVPSAQRRGQVGVAGAAGLVEGGEPAGCTQAPAPSIITMRSAAAASSSRSWLIRRIVLGERRDLLLEPALGRQVEEVVGLVEQQDVDVGREQRLEHEPLALAARQLGDRPVARLVEGLAQHALAARVPAGLLVVAADLAPRRRRPRPGRCRWPRTGRRRWPARPRSARRRPRPGGWDRTGRAARGWCRCRDRCRWPGA